MKIIALSDSHGSTFNIKALLKMHPDADLYVHCGDGCEDFIRLCNEKKLPCLAVRGNCDVYSKTPLEESIVIGDKTLVVTHGHLYSVKSTTQRLMEEGSKRQADIILFGHTHEPLSLYIDEEGFEKPFYLINPGSIAQPRSGNPTYALIEIRENGVLASTPTLY